MPRTNKRKRATLASPRNLNSSGAYNDATPDAHRRKPNDKDAQDADTAITPPQNTVDHGGETLSKVGEAIRMLAAAQAAQTAKDNKLGCALEAIVADDRKKRDKDKKGVHRRGAATCNHHRAGFGARALPLLAALGNQAIRISLNSPRSALSTCYHHRAGFGAHRTIRFCAAKPSPRSRSAIIIAPFWGPWGK